MDDLNGHFYLKNKVRKKLKKKSEKNRVQLLRPGPRVSTRVIPGTDITGILNWVGEDCGKSLSGGLGQSHGFVCTSYNHTIFPKCDKVGSPTAPTTVPDGEITNSLSLILFTSVLMLILL